MEYSQLMCALASAYKDNQSIVFYLKNGVVFRSSRSTGIFESDNGLEMDNKDFMEYYAIGAEITDILKIPNEMSLDEKMKFKEGSFVEISLIQEPLKAELGEGRVIWENQQC
jgi:hypothetical protein